MCVRLSDTSSWSTWNIGAPHNHAGMAANRRFLTCCIVLSLLLSGISCVESAEVGNDQTSTHGTKQDESRQHGGGAAPTTAGLTPQERQQLLQIEQTIRQASNPREAIQQIAEANQMSQEALVQLLNQNRQELEQQQGSRGSSSLQGGSLASTIARFVTSMGVMVQHFAKQNPKQFSLIVSASLLMIYVVITAPRCVFVLLVCFAVGK